MKISILIPVYNEQDNLQPLIAALRDNLAGSPEYQFEIVFIDDFSSDGSFDILSGFTAEDKFEVKVIRLARNSGSHIALFTGLEYCTGDVAIYLAADLQCRPDVVFKLIDQYEQGFPIVWGLRDSRRDKWLVRIFSRTYYAILKTLVKQVVQFANIETFLIQRRVIDQFKSIREKNTNILLLIASLGFRQGSVTVEHLSRHSGRSKWSTSRKVKLLTDSLVSFSYLPIRFISLLGIFFSFCGFFWALVEIYLKFQDTSRPLGYTSIFVLILIVSGLQMFMLGVVGEYLWRAFDQISTKPMIVIDKLLGFENRQDDLNLSGDKH